VTPPAATYGTERSVSGCGRLSGGAIFGPMRFTSGGTDGPRFVPDGPRFVPDGDMSNVYGLLPSARSARDVAESFYGAGWRVRMSSETEFEVENTYAELDLYPQDPVLFSGIVVPERIETFLSALTALGLRYEVELYGTDDAPPTIYRS
jgi:hypothetical protein